MSPRHPTSFHLPRSTPEPDADWRTLRRLLPYLWPRGSLPLRARVVIAVLLIAAAKATTVYVPLLYKHAVDALSHPAAVALAVPIGFVVAYGVARALQAALSELREIVFTRVAQKAMHAVALETFQHLHRLSLRFHLERQTGGLSPALQPRPSGIRNIPHHILFHIIPTVVEKGLGVPRLWGLYDAAFP